MSSDSLLSEKREQILRIAAKYGARNVRVFGSAATGELREGSDVDILVDLDEGRSLLDLAGLMLELQELLGRPVDIGTAKGLKPRYRQRILSEAVPL